MYQNQRESTLIIRNNINIKQVKYKVKINKSAEVLNAFIFLLFGVLIFVQYFLVFFYNEQKNHVVGMHFFVLIMNLFNNINKDCVDVLQDLM